jgi:hypothetical protein
MVHQCCPSGKERKFLTLPVSKLERVGVYFILIVFRAASRLSRSRLRKHLDCYDRLQVSTKCWEVRLAGLGIPQRTTHVLSIRDYRIGTVKSLRR